MPIPISQLPPELVYNGQLDVSNPAKQTEYDQLNSAYEKNNGSGSLPALKPFPDIKLSDIGGSAVDFAQGLNESEDSAFNDYLKFQQSQPKPLDIYSTLENQAGLPQLRQTQSTLQGTIGDIEDSLRRVEPDVTAKTYNSLATEAQRRGMVNAESAPLQDKLGWFTQSLGRVGQSIDNATADIGTKVGLALQGQQQDLDPYKQRMTMVADQNARLMTGFTADREDQLNILLAKIQRDDNISDMEWQQAADLAKQQQQYQLELQNEMAKTSNASDRYISVGDKSSLYDTSTGKFITAPSSGGSSGGGIASYYTGGGDYSLVP